MNQFPMILLVVCLWKINVIIIIIIIMRMRILQNDPDPTGSVSKTLIQNILVSLYRL